MVTRGKKACAMWHQTSGHLAHGKPSFMTLVKHEISGGD